MNLPNPIEPIPMSSPDLTEAERAAVLAVLNTPNLSMGPQIGAFEQAICQYTGSKHAIAVNSGTAGLHLCVRAAGIGQGDLVITTPFSFVASANALLFENAVPVFVDVDPETGNINPRLVKHAAEGLSQGGQEAQPWLPRKGTYPNGSLKAILPVDVFGQPADMDDISATAANHKLRVIEDSCEAIGATYKGRPAGRLGDFGIFAFYPNKQMTTGEGGVIVTDDDQAANFMRSLRNQGRAVGDTWLQHTFLGYNYRMDDLSAALGRVQVGRLDEMLEKRLQVAQWYAERLAEIPGVQPLTIQPNTTRMSWFVYVVRFDPQIDRDRLAKELAGKGIPSRPYFSPIHLQPYMVERFGFQTGDFPITEDLGRRSLALPFSGVMPETHVERVCTAIQAAVANQV